MKRTKLVTTLAALPLSLVLLAGCGGGESDEKPEPSASPTVEAPQVQGRGSGTSNPSDGGGSESPAPSEGQDGEININSGSTPEPTVAPSSPSESPSEGDRPPSDLGESTGPESNYGGTNNKQCEGVQGPIPKGEDGYSAERDADNDGIACEPNDGGVGAEDTPQDESGDSQTPSDEAPGDGADSGDTGGDSSDSGSLGVPDGTVIWAVTTEETKIYSSTDRGSQALGTAVNGASFKGTVTADGKWVKIDRSAGYIPASAVRVDRKL